MPLHLNRRSGFIDKQRAQTAVQFFLELDEISHGSIEARNVSHYEVSLLKKSRVVHCKDQSSISAKNIDLIPLTDWSDGCFSRSRAGDSRYLTTSYLMRFIFQSSSLLRETSTLALTCYISSHHSLLSLHKSLWFSYFSAICIEGTTNTMLRSSLERLGKGHVTARLAGQIAYMYI